MKNKIYFLFILLFVVILLFSFLLKVDYIFFDFKSLYKQNISDSFVYNLKSQIYALSGKYISSDIYLTGNDFRYYFNSSNNKLFYFLDNFSIDKITSFTGFLNTISFLDKIIEGYNISKYILSGSKNNDFYLKKVDYNLSYVKNLKNNIYLYQCTVLSNDVFKNYFYVFNQYKIYLNQFRRFETDIKTFIINEKNQNIKDCLKKIYINQLKEKVKIENIINRLKDYKYKTWYNIRKILQNPKYCIDLKQDFFDILSNNLKSILLDIKSKGFFLQNLDLNNKDLLLNLCKNDNGKKQNKEDNLSKAFKNIQDLLEKQHFESEKKEKGKSKQEDNQVTSPYKNHIPFPLKDANKIKEYIKNKSDQVYNKLQDVYQSSGYNPYDFIRKYFIKFFGNLEDYKDFNN